MATTVSIVEDNEQLRGTLARMIGRAEGFQCLGDYGTAEDALEAIPKHPPNVVLMDINLPGMNGVECVRKLKQLAPATQVVPRLLEFRRNVDFDVQPVREARLLDVEIKALQIDLFGKRHVRARIE